MLSYGERILNRCSKILLDGKEVDLTAEHMKAFEIAYEKLASSGERVLGFAHTRLSEEEYPQDFEFNGEDEDANFPTVMGSIVRLTIRTV